MSKTKNLGVDAVSSPRAPVIGVFATSDPRIDKKFHERGRNIVRMTAEAIAGGARLPDGTAPEIVYSPVLVTGEREADAVARQFKDAGANILVCAPDAWCFPQPTLISLLSHFPPDTPVNVVCGNSGPKPGVVFAQAAVGALAQAGRLAHLTVGNWPDDGMDPEMSGGTAEALVDWCHAALAFAGLKGRRVVVWGHDSMGMETALSHVVATRRTFGLEITRLDMKLLSDMLAKKAYKAAELRKLRAWIARRVGPRLELRGAGASESLDTGLAMYLVVRDVMRDLNAVGGGFMNQLEWGSDRRGLPLPGPDAMESLFNSTFDHDGPKPPLPYATEADMQGLLTMLAFTWLSGGNPPLFMDFRKVWEPWEIRAFAEKIGVPRSEGDVWAEKGFVDGDNSGSASLDWAGRPGDREADVMKNVFMPAADPDYFPGGGNSVSFITPGGIDGIAGRLAFSALANQFSMFWDEASTIDMPAKLAKAVSRTSSEDWPHTWVTPKYASMAEYKQYAPANHLHMTWNLKPARLQYWMDMTNVLSVAPWKARPAFIEGVDRPQPLVHLVNGGELRAKSLLR